ncbi:MAG: hypothetical protein M0022_08105 [Desulfobacteraceae bacterium]|nr:hypothetical protein [Desulfobacteraceae bacterium]
MKITIAQTLIMAMLIWPISSNCSANKEKQLIGPEGQSITDTCATKEIQITVNLQEEKKVQRAVDKGHQPWRLDPIDTAHVTIIKIDNTVPHESCMVISETEIEAYVKCKGRKRYIIELKRLIKPKGIWTATAIEIMEKK